MHFLVSVEPFLIPETSIPYGFILIVYMQEINTTERKNRKSIVISYVLSVLSHVFTAESPICALGTQHVNRNIEQKTGEEVLVEASLMIGGEVGTVRLPKRAFLTRLRNPRLVDPA